MLEQNLAALFRGFATEIESHRTSLEGARPTPFPESTQNWAVGQVFGVDFFKKQR